MTNASDYENNRPTTGEKMLSKDKRKVLEKMIESLDSRLAEAQSQCHNAEWHMARCRAHEQVLALLRQYEPILKMLDCHKQKGVKP